MIICISEHSVETDILTPGGWVMDFGCGVDLTFSMKMIEMGMKVISVDPNPNIINTPHLENLFYERKALVTDESIESISLDVFNDTDAASIIKTDNDISFVRKENTITVETTTIKKCPCVGWLIHRKLPLPLLFFFQIMPHILQDTI